MRGWSLTTRFAVTSLVAVVALGVALDLAVQHVLTTSATAEAARSGELLGQFVQDGLTPEALTRGLSPEQHAALATSTRGHLDRGELHNVLVWGGDGLVLFDGEGSLAGRRLPVSAPLAAAYRGRLSSELEQQSAPERDSSAALLEVYVPLQLRDAQGRRGVLEIYLPYSATAARTRHASRVIGLLLLLGLAALWLLMWWLSVSVNRRLRRQAALDAHRASHDPLTDLPNRRMLADELQRALAHDEPVTLLLLDLDRFKEVNDALGHTIGDELLRDVAARLQAHAGTGDLVARLGGDEFALLVPGALDADQARALGRRVAATFDDAFPVGGVLLDVEASVGVTLAPQHGRDVQSLLQHADVVMYAAKATHTGVALYDQHLDANTLEQLSLLGELRTALDGAGGLHLLYQPTVEIATGEVVGVEALLRWEHATRGLVSPADFVPLAERTGLITPLTQLVLDLALAQGRSWLDAGLRLPIAVNLSARNLLEDDLPERVEAVLARHDVPAQLLVLEITESAMVEDPVRAESVVRSLVALGIRIAIDDFGTGYSSMVSLTRLPLDCLKVDRAFVADLDTGGPGAVIATTSIKLAHDLGLRVVAEGVETAEQLAALAELGCDVAQGYLLSRPLPAAQVPAFVAAREAAPLRG